MASSAECRQRSPSKLPIYMAERKRKPGKKPMSVPTTTNDTSQGPPNPSRWFQEDRRCRGEKAHVILTEYGKQFHAAMRDGSLPDSAWDEMEHQLSNLAEALSKVGCDQFYAHAIERLRMSAFVLVPAKSDFVWRCYGLLNDTWNDCYRGDQDRIREEKANNRQYTPVFNREEFLAGWTDDLGNGLVQPESLRSYVQALGCEGLHDCERFDAAIEELAEYFRAEFRSPNAKKVAKAADPFLETLRPLAKKDKERLIRDYSRAHC